MIPDSYPTYALLQWFHVGLKKKSRADSPNSQASDLIHHITVVVLYDSGTTVYFIDKALVWKFAAFSFVSLKFPLFTDDKQNSSDKTNISLLFLRQKKSKPLNLLLRINILLHQKH